MAGSFMVDARPSIADRQAGIFLQPLRKCHPAGRGLPATDAGLSVVSAASEVPFFPFAGGGCITRGQSESTRQVEAEQVKSRVR